MDELSRQRLCISRDTPLETIQCAACADQFKIGDALIPGDFEQKVQNGSSVTSRWTEMEHGSSNKHTYVGMDISDLVVREQETKEKLKKKDLALVRSNHDLRSPIHSIQGAVELMESMQGMNQDCQDMLGIIKHCSTTLKDLVDDILENSLINLNRLTLSNHAFAVRDFVNINEGQFRLLAQKKNLDFVMRYESEDHMVLIGDVLKIKRVVQNLIQNAIRYTREGNVICEVTTLPLDSTHCQLQFMIEDTGEGIAEDRVKTIFNEYQGSEKDESLGVGLYNCKAIANKMGGNIQVNSRLGDGSSFSFTLPLKMVRHQENIHRFLRRNYQKTAVLVDDYQPYHQVLRSKLHILGIHLKCCSSAKQLYEINQEELNRFDIYFIDLEMRDVNGLQLVEQLRNLGHEQPMICYSSYPSDEMKRITAKAGFTNWVEKSSSVADLATTVLDPLFSAPTD